MGGASEIKQLKTLKQCLIYLANCETRAKKMGLYFDGCSITDNYKVFSHWHS